MEAYCVKCWGKRTIKNPRRIALKSGREVVLGTCDTCGSRLFRTYRMPAVTPVPRRAAT